MNAARDLSDEAEAAQPNPVVPLLIKPIVCRNDMDLRQQGHAYRRDQFFNEKWLVTLERNYNTQHEAELRCLETGRRWIVK